MKTEHDISKLEEPAIFGSETMRITSKRFAKETPNLMFS